MNRADKVKELLLRTYRQDSSSADDEMDERILGEASTTMKQALAVNERNRQAAMWRTIMKSHVLKLSVAAIVILTAIVMLNQFGGSVGPAGVAWGQVVELMEGMPSIVHRQSRIVTCEGKEVPHLSSRNVVTQGDPAIGYREDMYDDQGNLMHRVFLLMGPKVSITVVPILREYKIENLTDQQLSAFQMPFSQIIEQIKSENYTDLGRRIINGVETEGIEFDTPLLMIESYPVKFDKMHFRIWADVKTSLPLQMEVDAVTSDKFITLFTGGKPVEVTAIMDQVEWHVEIDHSVLEPEIPDDYTLTSNDAQDEGKAVDGLREFAELTNGQYPASLNMAEILRDGFEIIKDQLGGDALETDEGKTMWRRVISVKPTCLFHNELVKQGKAPAYYGDTVSANDVSDVLLRWKSSEDEYRVVFGDLTIKNVGADRLAELEQAVTKLKTWLQGRSMHRQ
jgi:hypothetical protein